MTPSQPAVGPKVAPGTTGTLGTFAGVFTPSILTILGIILFLRLGNVVGSAGLPRALLIILIANAISVLTSISLSAIASNLRVKGGGDYYLISRTLGVEFGGALGLVLFLAQSVSIAFYAIGFGEALVTILRVDSPWIAQLVAAAAIAALFLLAWLGADWATRFQYVVMGVLVLALTGFFIGGLAKWNFGTLSAGLEPGSTTPFWAIFALFFPAVTGFTQGVSMSGDLKDPGRSLPLGTFLAVGISFVVYVGVAVVFAAAVPAGELATDNGAMRRVSLFAWLVDAGVIAATLSSALASFLGAPRILQSLARDRVFTILNPFAEGSGPSGNPRRGVLLSAGIAFVTVALGDLDVIAPIVSMFFLISYGLLNYATYVEARANSPSFRPRFRFFHQRLSLAGGLGCLGAMLAINPTAGAVAVAVLFAVHQYLSQKVVVDRWADSERSRRFQRLRNDIRAISREPEHPRYWRPVLLAISDEPEHRSVLLRFARWLEGNSGITSAVRVVTGRGPRARLAQQEAEKELRLEIEKAQFQAFPRVVVAPDIEGAVPVMLQSYGLGPVRANTVLMNWFDRGVTPDGAPRLRAYDRYLRLSLRFGVNLVVLGADTDDLAAIATTRPGRRIIDVWYRDNGTGRLTLLLAYLMTRSEEWEDARIRVLSVAPEGRSDREALNDLERMLEDVRISAEPHIVEEASKTSIVRHSSGSSVVFLPLRIEDDGPKCAFGDGLEELIEVLGVVVTVLAAQDISLDAEPEAGAHAAIAEAVDGANKALKTADLAEQEAAETEKAAEDLEQKLEQARIGGPAELEFPEIERAVTTAREEAEQARRRAARARAKADDAATEAEGLTGVPVSQKEKEKGEQT